MNATKNSLLTLTLIATLSGVAGAQQVSIKSTASDQTFGLSSCNVQFYAGGSIRREDMRYRATPSSTPRGPIRMRYDADSFLFVHTHVFGHKYTAFVARADAHLVEGYGNNSPSYYAAGTPRYSSARGHVRLRLAGYTFLERTVYADGHIGHANYTRNVIDVSKTFYPGGVPVTVGVTGGGTLNLSADAALIFNPTQSTRMTSGSRVELTGSGTGYCRGTASAAVGWSGFGAGVEFELRFLNSTLSLGVEGSATRLEGFVRLYVQPIRIFLNAFAECGARYTMNIYNWALGSAFTWRRTFS